MTLKFVQEIKNEINSLFLDNNSGLITPAILREVTQDMCDSLYARQGALYRVSTMPVVQSLTTTPTNYPALFDTTAASDPAVVATNLVAGTITTNVTGFSIVLGMSITVDGPNGRVVSSVIAKNGVQINRSRISVTCSGAGNKESNNAYVPLNGVSANDVFTMLLSVDSATSVTVSNISLDLQLVPTYSAL